MTSITTCVLYHPARPVHCLRRALVALDRATKHRHVVEVIVQGPLQNDVQLPKAAALPHVSLQYFFNDRNMGSAMPMRASIQRFLGTDHAYWAKCDDDMSFAPMAWDRAIEALETEERHKQYKCGCAMIAVPAHMWSGRPRIFYREKRIGAVPTLKWRIDSYVERTGSDQLRWEVCDFADHGCTVFNRAVFEDGCLPDARLFTGGIDFDLCLEMLARGYKSILVTQPRSNHHHGECKPYRYGVVRYDAESTQSSGRILQEKWGVEIELLTRYQGDAHFAKHPGRESEFDVHKREMKLAQADASKPMTKPSGNSDVSRVGLWDHKYKTYQGERKLYGDPHTASMAAKFFNDEGVRLVEDWGCGYGGFKTFLRHDQVYVGVDGSETPFRDVEADLTHYGTVADGILLRHVLDHNTEWRSILANACASFRKKLVVILFTPFSDETKRINAHPSAVAGVRIPDIAFSKKELLDALPSHVKWELETVETRSAHGREHVLFITRAEPNKERVVRALQDGESALSADWHRSVVIGNEGWDEGQSHLEFLQKQGLCSQSRVLDVGCGPLRTGIPLIRHLAAGCYVGIDNEPLLVAAAIEHELADIELQKKQPIIRFVDDFDVTAWCAEKFDMAWAYSVLTHLTHAGIEQCLRKVMPLLVDGGVFFASMNLASETVIGPEHPWRREILRTRYTKDDINKIADAVGCRCERVSGPLTEAWKDKNLQNIFAFTRNV